MEKKLENRLDQIDQTLVALQKSVHYLTETQRENFEKLQKSLYDKMEEMIKKIKEDQ